MTPPASRRREFRVRWTREDRQQATRIYQSHDSAWRKARGIVGLEAVKGDTSFAEMPDLVEGPIIESRPVGEWEPVDLQVTEVEDGQKRAMADWAEYTRPMQPAVEDAGDPW